MRISLLLLAGCLPPSTSPTERPFCGGFAGIACAEGSTCLDDPADDCDPYQGGADCGGLCYDCDDPSLGRDYVARDPEKCALIDFDCEGGEAGFSDACGCGCA